MERGLFITLEGGEGAGKSTQIKHLADYLKNQKQDVIVTREPGGTPEAEAVRGLLSDPEFGPKWNDEAQTMLLFAARAMHIKDVIAPALAAGKTVISDRYIDSTRVYQGHIGNINPLFLAALELQIVGDYMPNLTLILDIPSDETIKRIESRGGAKDHYDNASAAFHEKIREGFLEIAQNEPERCHVIDAVQGEIKIAAQIEYLIQGILNGDGDV